MCSARRTVGSMAQEKGSRERCRSWTVLHAQCTSTLYSAFPISQGNAEALERWGGKTKHRLISYFLSNTSAKNYRNRIVYVKSTASQRWDVFETWCISNSQRNVATRFRCGWIFSDTCIRNLGCWVRSWVSFCNRSAFDKVTYIMREYVWFTIVNDWGFHNTNSLKRTMLQTVASSNQRDRMI